MKTFWKNALSYYLVYTLAVVAIMVIAMAAQGALETRMLVTLVPLIIVAMSMYRTIDTGCEYWYMARVARKNMATMEEVATTRYDLGWSMADMMMRATDFADELAKTKRQGRR